MIGMFTSTVPFRFKLDEFMNSDQLMKQVNRELKLCLLNPKYPYDLLINDLELAKQGYDSLFKMCVNYYNLKYENDIEKSIHDIWCELLNHFMKALIRGIYEFLYLMMKNLNLLV